MASRKTLLVFDLRDTLITFVISLVICTPFIGIYKDTRSISEEVIFRWHYVLGAVFSMVLLRIIVHNLRHYFGQISQDKTQSGAVVLNQRRKIRIYSMMAMIGFAFVLPLTPWGDRLLIDRLTLMMIYVMLGWGLNVVVGLAGLLDLGYVAFYAVGAYSYALFAIHMDLGFWSSLPFAGLLAAFFGILLGFPVLRLRGDYLAIVTLGFGEIIRIMLLATPFLGESRGISGIPRPTFFGLPLTNSPDEGQMAFHEFFNLDYSSMHRIIFLYYLILILALATNWFTLRLRNLPIGRAWEALRENDIACQSMGINPTNTKLTAFAIGAMLAGFAGSFFATRQGFISPESFTFLESAIVVAIVVLGGLGSQVGIIFAAAFLILLPEYFREFEAFRMLFFGAAMVGITVWKPKGFVSVRTPTVHYYALDTSSGKNALTDHEKNKP